MALLFIVAGSVMAMAGDDLPKRSGSLAELKNGGTGIVTFDFKGAVYDKDKPLEMEYRNLDDLMEGVKGEFIREFNEEAKKFRMLHKREAGCYVFNVKVTKMDRYVNVFAWKPGITTKIFGTIRVLNPEGDEIAMFEIDDVQNEGIGIDASFEEAFEELAETLAKKVNKAK